MKSNEKHEALYQALLSVIKSTDLDAIEILAITSNIVGKTIAFQDQRKYTSDQIMSIVRKNIEEGNKQMIDTLMNSSNETPI